jgi:hypothetical protein
MDRRPGEGGGAGEEPVPDPGLPGDAAPGPGPSAGRASARSPGGETPDPNPGPSVEGSAASGPAARPPTRAWPGS